MPQISFIICAVRLKPSLAEVVERIEHHFRPGDELILIISSKSKGHIPQDFSSRLSEIVFTDEIGCGAFRDIGVKSATKELIAFVDDDTILLDHWRVEVERSFDISSVAFYIAQSKRSPSVMLSSQIPTPFVFFSDTAGSVFRKTILESVGGFDKRMIRSEDTDVTTRITSRGWDCAVGSVTIEDSESSNWWQKLRKTISSLKPHARICIRAGMRIEVKSFFELMQFLYKRERTDLSPVNIIMIYLGQNRPDQFQYHKFPRHSRVVINLERSLFVLADGARIIFGQQKIKLYHMLTREEILLEGSDCEISSNKSMVSIKILTNPGNYSSFSHTSLLQRPYQI